MEKIRFGKTGLMVSKVAFGGIPIMRISKTEAANLVREAINLGVNFIDTAAADEAIPLAKKLDMGFIAMKPMGGGLLDNAGLSFRYLGQYDSIVPDPGIEKMEEIREIIGIVEKNETLSPEDTMEIEKQRVEFGPSWCHRCDYCQPCPQDIGISSALNAKSFHKRLTLERARQFVEPAIEKARTCLECNTCVTRCPYHLEIPSLLKEAIRFWDSLPK